MEIKKNSKQYDVIIVGSGAGGGMATKILSEAGLTVAVVESGPYYDPANPEQMTQLKWAWESPRRGAGSTRPFGDFDQAYGGWDIDGEPYTQKDDTNFRWFRSRMLGGRTNHWGRISLRFGPNDFKKKSVDGLGEDWPITYDDLKPYFKAAVGNYRVTEDAKKEFSKLKLDINKISNLMNTHHNYLKNELKITTPEIDKMIDVTKKNGAIGSKIVGSGGGGSIVSLSTNSNTSNKIVSELKRIGVKDVFIAKKGKGPTINYE